MFKIKKHSLLTKFLFGVIIGMCTLASAISSYFIYEVSAESDHALEKMSNVIAHMIADSTNQFSYLWNNKVELEALTNKLSAYPDVYSVEFFENNKSILKTLLTDEVLPTTLLHTYKKSITYSELSGNYASGLTVDDFENETKEIQLGGKVVVIMSKKSIITRQRDRIKKTIIITVFFVCISVILMIVTFNKIVSRPLKSLAHSINLMAKGDYMIRAEIKDTGEIKSLVDSFNKMAETIEKAQRDLGYTLEQEEEQRILAEEARYEAEAANQERKFYMDKVSVDILKPVLIIFDFIKLTKKITMSNNDKNVIFDEISKSSSQLELIAKEMSQWSSSEEKTNESAEGVNPHQKPNKKSNVVQLKKRDS